MFERAGLGYSFMVIMYHFLLELSVMLSFFADNPPLASSSSPLNLTGFFRLALFPGFFQSEYQKWFHDRISYNETDQTKNCILLKWSGLRLHKAG